MLHSQVRLDAMKDKDEASGEQEEDEKEPVIHAAASPPPHWVSVCCLSRVLPAGCRAVHSCQ